MRCERRPDKAKPPSGKGANAGWRVNAYPAYDHEAAIRQWDFHVALVEWFRSPAWGSFINLLCGERDKGSGRAPLVNPRGPARKSVLRTALTSRVPDCGRLDSTSCLGSPLSAIHGVQTLSFTLRFADFSGDTTPSLPYRKKKQHWCRCRLVFVGRIRRSRHPAKRHYSPLRTLRWV